MRTNQFVGCARSLSLYLSVSPSPVDKTKQQPEGKNGVAKIETNHISQQQQIDSFDEGRRITWQFCVCCWHFIGFGGHLCVVVVIRFPSSVLAHSNDFIFIYIFVCMAVITCLLSTIQEKFPGHGKLTHTIFVPYIHCSAPSPERKKNLPRHNKPHYSKVYFLVYILIQLQRKKEAAKTFECHC